MPRFVRFFMQLRSLQPIRFKKELNTRVCCLQNAWVLPSVENDLPRDSLPTNMRGRYSTFALANPSSIDPLLGSDVYASIMDGRKAVVDKYLPVVFSSVFDRVLIGRQRRCWSISFVAGFSHRFH